MEASEAVLTVGHTLTAAITLTGTDRALTVESCGGQDCYVLVEESYEQKHPPVDDVVAAGDDETYTFGEFGDNSYSEETNIFGIIAVFQNYAICKMISGLRSQMRRRP